MRGSQAPPLARTRVGIARAGGTDEDHVGRFVPEEPPQSVRGHRTGLQSPRHPRDLRAQPGVPAKERDVADLAAQDLLGRLAGVGPGSTDATSSVRQRLCLFSGRRLT